MKRNTQLLVGTLALFLGVAGFAAPIAPTSAPTPAAALVATPAPAPVATPKADPAPVVAPVTSPAPVIAQPTQDNQQWWQAIMLTIIQTVLAVATPILVVLLGGLLRKWRLNVEKDKLEWIVSKATGYGEQMAKRALKEGKPLAGPDILRLATEKGTAWLADSGLQKQWGSKLADLLEAKLGQHALNGQPKE